MSTGIDYWFPLETPRPAQLRALEFIEKAWRDGKNTVVLQLPVGIGKSPLAVAASRLSAQIPYIDEDGKSTSIDESTWLLTTQHVLQDQYINDFSNHLQSVMSKVNYECCLGPKKEGYSCDQGTRFLKTYGRDFDDIIANLPNSDGGKKTRHLINQIKNKGHSELPCGKFQTCPYKTAFIRWCSAPLSLTNMSYFMALARSNPDKHKRHLLIIDEAHLLDEEIIRFHEVGIQKKFITEELKLVLPLFETTSDMVLWMKEAMLPELLKRIKFIEGIVLGDAASGRDTSSSSIRLVRLENFLKKTVAFMSADLADWVICNSDNGEQTVKPVRSGKIGPSSILQFGKRRILMSGTILDKDIYCRHAGLKSDKTAFYEEESPFDEENRMVVRRFAGSMGRKKQQETLPLMIDSIKELLHRHKDEKGIIHTGSYRLNNLIVDEIKDPRVIFHTDAKTRNDALKRHIESDEPTVLVSPSMGMGVDLKDDIARWGAVCKVPFPYLGDARVIKLFECDEEWYYWKTSQSIIQYCGRIIRSQDDYGIMYILDKDFNMLLMKHGTLFPKWWKEGLRDEEV